FHYLILKYAATIWLHRRGTGDIWQNLYEPLLLESTRLLDVCEIAAEAMAAGWQLNGDISFAGSLKQRLTHQLLELRFFTVELFQKPVPGRGAGNWQPLTELQLLAFPRSVVTFFQKN